MTSADESPTIARESGKQPETGALTTSGGSSNHALRITTWGSSVASLEHLCDQSLVCPCRTCSAAGSSTKQRHDALPNARPNLEAPRMARKTDPNARAVANVDDQITRMWATYRKWVAGQKVDMDPFDLLAGIDLLLEQRHDLTTTEGEMLNKADIATNFEWGEADTGTAA